MFEHWSQAYVGLVIWLFENDHLNVEKIKQEPLKNGKNSMLLECNLDHNHLYQLNGISYKALGKLGIGLNVNFSTKDKWKRALWLLGQAGVNPINVEFYQFDKKRQNHLFNYVDKV